jgi:histidinol dehydrogenase
VRRPLACRCACYTSQIIPDLPLPRSFLHSGFARQFSGVNTVSFQKHITSQEVTEEGMLGLGPTVIRLAECEGLEAHAYVSSFARWDT